MQSEPNKIQEHLTHHHHDHQSVSSDPKVFRNEFGIKAIQISFIGLFITAVLQLIVVILTGSVALLADTIHNFADAGTSIPLWIAFHFSKKKSTERFTYGYGRLEDFAGLIILFVILGSAIGAGYVSMIRFVQLKVPQHLWAVVAASFIGFAGNEAVAQYRIRTGKKIGSAALVADGQHARIDGLTSLAVIFAVIGVKFGYALTDPIIALLISVGIFRILIQASREVILRMLDAVDPGLVDEIRQEAKGIPKVEEVTEVRMRWIGHWLHAEINIAVDSRLSVEEAHGIALETRHELLHKLSFLSDCIIHVDPITLSGEEHHVVKAHSHDDFDSHSH
jgi:cation diffusion facilitator family transporter